ncbi:cell division site-positioning protein MapZ family protein [Streptococcus pneumoniae]
MDEKDLKKQTDSTLDFEKAKEMTVGQAMRKNEEFEAGVNPTDNVLDKYIKQHVDEIAAGKFDTKVVPTVPVKEVVETTAISDMIQTVREEVASPTPVMDDLEDDEDDEVAVLPFYKQKKVIYSAVGVLLVALIGGTGYLALNKTQAKPAATTSSTSSSKAQVSSSSEEKTALKEFNDLYDSFFTDANKLALKNSSFGNLDQLKAAVEKLKDTPEYTAAKAKYDSLVKQISVVQAVNSQFESAAITDGVLDTNAKAKSDAQFKDEDTGNADLDKVIKSAISLGRSQQVATPAPQTETVAPEAAAQASPAPAPAPATQTEVVQSQVQVAGVPVSPIAPVANMQRNLSRVPYNQAAIDDVTNPAWVFNPGVLEKILQTSRERGYITGDNYIIERVNIVNGNGYYNLFKPDGTYLFSINCKTGYFVGNAKGNADALDY